MVYGKLWNTFWTGSMYGKGAVRQIVMAYCISNANRQNIVELNPQMLAHSIGETVEDTKEAIEFLSSPDLDSRTQKEDGRRIKHLEGFAYRVINRDKYTMMQNERDMLASSRRSTRKYEAKKRLGNDFDEIEFYKLAVKNWPEDYIGVELPDGVDPPDVRSAHVDVDVDIDIDSNSGVIISNSKSNTSNTSINKDSNSTVNKRKHVAKNPPTVEEIHEHILSKGVKANDVSWRLAQQILEHNEESGWRRADGKPIYVWRSHVNQWVERRMGGAGEPGRLTPDVRKVFADQRKAREQEEKLRAKREAELDRRSK